jgi:16S rRNA (uracil1498-N3)-methyltransferase
VVERQHRSPVVNLFCDEAIAEGEMRLRDGAAHHARVRRVHTGQPLRLLDGKGRIAAGTLVTLAKDDITVSVEHVMDVPRPVLLEVIVPIADRDRMLWAAEKCVELQITAWRPAYFARSRSVSPRGEGARFREKVRARMRSALEQSGGAWLPELHDDCEFLAAMHAVDPAWRRLLMEAGGGPLSELTSNVATVMAVGPEGGIDDTELTLAHDNGWLSASLGAVTLRFETAIIAGAAVIRATQLSPRS